MKIAIISGSPRKKGYTHYLMREVEKLCEGNEISYIDLSNPLTPMGGEQSDETEKAVEALYNADVWLIGTPVYNSAYSSALKNLFEWCDHKKTEGKVAGFVILASGQQSYVYVQGMLTTIMSYFNVRSNPRAVFANRSQMDKEGNITDNELTQRLQELVDSIVLLK